MSPRSSDKRRSWVNWQEEVLLGNLSLLGFSRLDYLGTDSAIDLFARLGVVLLLFQVGLESSVAHMRRVGLSSLFAAILGITGSFVLGWGVAAWLLPASTLYTRLFLAASLTATSVGITARVLKELGRLQTDEARIILGAAIVDDVIGLVMLAVITGLFAAADVGGVLSYSAIGGVFVKATMFLVGALLLGTSLSRHLVSFALTLEAGGALLAFCLVICFVLAWLASAVGLAPIVGAFAAGLILEDLQSSDFIRSGKHSLHDLIEPIASFLVPVFFVVMGARTHLAVFAEPGALGLALVLTGAAVLGKQCCALGVLGRRFDRLSVGFGMMPRGEVQLIFASTGLTLTVAGRSVLDETMFSAIVVMVIATTVITPAALKWSFKRGKG